MAEYFAVQITFGSEIELVNLMGLAQELELDTWDERLPINLEELVNLGTVDESCTVWESELRWGNTEEVQAFFTGKTIYRINCEGKYEYSATVEYYNPDTISFRFNGCTDGDYSATHADLVRAEKEGMNLLEVIDALAKLNEPVPPLVITHLGKVIEDVPVPLDWKNLKQNYNKSWLELDFDTQLGLLQEDYAKWSITGD